jgi:phenylpyruvate tautomerase PptA (4-oxalocrotonate tautomerase family)
MPNILVKVPMGAFAGDSARTLLREITHAAATAEQIPAEQSFRLTSWVVIDQVESRLFSVAGVDMSEHVVPCIAVVYVPEGVLDEASRALYVKRVHDAFKTALPATETRRLATSVILHAVEDGRWGGNGAIFRLADLARSAGYAHLQHLVAPGP